MPRIVVAVATVMLGIGSGAIAQPASPATVPRLELWAGVSVTPSGASGQLVSSYSPPLLFDGDFTSHGAQTLTFSSRSAAGFEDDYRVALSLDPASALGYNLGGDLSVTVHRGVASG